MFTEQHSYASPPNKKLTVCLFYSSSSRTEGQNMPGKGILCSEILFLGLGFRMFHFLGAKVLCPQLHLDRAKNFSCFYFSPDTPKWKKSATLVEHLSTGEPSRYISVKFFVIFCLLVSLSIFPTKGTFFFNL